jgi:hypothetical protein
MRNHPSFLNVVALRLHHLLLVPPLCVFCLMLDPFHELFSRADWILLVVFSMVPFASNWTSSLSLLVYEKPLFDFLLSAFLYRILFLLPPLPIEHYYYSKHEKTMSMLILLEREEDEIPVEVVPPALFVVSTT